MCLKIPLLVSAKEALYRKETAGKKKWLTYQNLLVKEHRELKVKSREQLTAEGY